MAENDQGEDLAPVDKVAAAKALSEKLIEWVKKKKLDMTCRHCGSNNVFAPPVVEVLRFRAVHDIINRVQADDRGEQYKDEFPDLSGSVLPIYCHECACEITRINLAAVLGMADEIQPLFEIPGAQPVKVTVSR